MPIPRPKILTVVTVPTGGWQLQMKLSAAAQFDTTATATVAAGDYFVSGDNQSDDFLYVLGGAIRDAINTARSTADDDQVMLWLDESTHKTKLVFIHSFFGSSPGYDVKVEWTALNGSSIAGVLGFDSAADDSSTGSAYPAFTGDYQHAYGWYADDDGQLEDLRPLDRQETDTLQVRSMTGKIVSQAVALVYDNELRLQWLPASLMFSDEKEYAQAPNHPYTRNKGLECWWLEAREGKRFRVYRDAQLIQSAPADRGSTAASTGTTLTDSNKTWSTEPQRWAGSIIELTPYVDISSVTTIQRWYVSSNTATVITVANASPSGYALVTGTDPIYRLYDHRYETYVLDLDEMKRFEPEDQHEALDYYRIVIPLLRYVA